MISDSLKQVAYLKDQCINLRYQLRQIEALKIACVAAEKLAEEHRAACEGLTREVFALTRLNELLKTHAQQILEQVSAQTTRRHNKPSKAASQIHER